MGRIRRVRPQAETWSERLQYGIYLIWLIYIDMFLRPKTDDGEFTLKKGARPQAETGLVLYVVYKKCWCPMKLKLVHDAQGTIWKGLQYFKNES